MRRIVGATAQPLVIVALLAVWQAVSMANIINPFLLPAPGDVALRLYADALSGDLWLEIGGSLMRASAGFAAAVAIGLPLGLAMGRLPWARWLFEPLVAAGFPMPKIAFLPIFILWFGVYDLSKIVMVTFSASFVVIGATASAAAGIDRYLVWSARSLGASPAAIFREIVLPAALPQILTGLQIAIPVALITTIGTEMLTGGNNGLGGAMLTAGRFADSVGVYAGIVASGLIGFFLVRVLELLRRRLLAWHAEARAEA